MVHRADHLTINPHLLIRLEREDGSIAALTVRAPVKGESLRVTRIEHATEPEIFTALLLHSQTETLSAAQFSDQETRRLGEMGVLLPEEKWAPQVSFSCDIDALPFDWIPARQRYDEHSSVVYSDLVVNPTLRYLGCQGPTAEMRGRVKLHNMFRVDRRWLTVEDAVTGMPCVYSYSESVANKIDLLKAGEPVPKTISPELRASLFAAGIVESESKAREAREECQRQRLLARATLARERYVVLPNMLAPFQLAAIRRYYQELISAGHLPFGDEEWPNRYFAARDPIAYFFHEQFKRLIGDIAGQPVKTSFCFFASYHPGSSLPAHRDREQCEWALSLPIDLSPESEVSPWPLHLQPPRASESTAIYSGVGDGTLYYGREVRHHRDELSLVDYCSFWFMFYVPEDFAGSLD